MQRQRIDVVIGTRPEAIKLAPVVHALAAAGQAPRLLLTGQHKLSVADHGLSAFERIALDCPGLSDPRRHARRVAQSVAPLLANRPDLLVVQGDTSSAYGGALAGIAACVPVAHVEAGLRSFDPSMPWPEEEFRTAIDAHAALLLAPTAGNARNLEMEGAAGEVHVTGNSGIDSLLAGLDQLPPPRPRPPYPVNLLVTCHRRESWDDGIRSLAEALLCMSETLPVTIDVVQHPNPMLAAMVGKLLGNRPSIRLVEPLGHSAMIAAMRAADVLLSDSGGVQEEAPVLGVPLLVLREKTERPEGIASGNMILVGTRSDRIVLEVTRLLDPAARRAMSRPAFPFGDGRSAPRIARRIVEFLNRQSAAFNEARRA